MYRLEDCIAVCIATKSYLGVRALLKPMINNCRFLCRTREILFFDEGAPLMWQSLLL